jgi:hypothetical protein
MPRNRTRENVSSFGTLELGSKTWGQINPVGTREPNTFPYDDGPDSIEKSPSAGSFSAPPELEEPVYYDEELDMAILESSKRLSRHASRVLRATLEQLDSEA